MSSKTERKNKRITAAIKKAGKFKVKSYPGLKEVKSFMCKDLGLHQFTSVGAGIWRCKVCKAFTSDKSQVTRTTQERLEFWITSGY